MKAESKVSTAGSSVSAVTQFFFYQHIKIQTHKKLHITEAI